jgi:glycosyltransferase involved in cell wall biosynthesis
VVFWSTVKPYKGVELFAELARSAAVRDRGLSLAVYGQWDPELAPLRSELVGLGVDVHDRFLDRDELLALLARDAVFLLPYQQGSQSGALYSLLNHGCQFLCSDTGDLGAFLRRYQLEGLLLADHSSTALLDCLDYLAAHQDHVVESLTEAQQAHQWDRLVAGATGVYDSRP